MLSVTNCFVRVTSEVQRNADLLVGFLRFIFTTISLENWEDKYIECAIENPNLSYCFKFLIVLTFFLSFFLRLVINN